MNLSKILLEEVYPKIKEEYKNGVIKKKDLIKEIARRFRLDRDTIYREVIPYLKKKGLIKLTRRIVFLR